MDVKGCLKAILYGFVDSLRGTVTLFYLDKEMNERRARISPTKSTSIRRKPSDTKESTPVRQLKVHEESKVLQRTFECCALNGGVFLLSILLFEYGLLPGINYILRWIFGETSFMGRMIWSWLQPLLSYLFKTVWVMPLFVLSKFINSLWFQDIADSAFRYSRGRPLFMQSVSKLIADSMFSIVVQTLFLIQAMLVSYIPIYMLGNVLSMVHMCLLYSLYAFEYKWFSVGWELHKRLAFIETNWPYFIGFGLPLAFLTQLSDSWIIRLFFSPTADSFITQVCCSGCIFSILFPLFIISANGANPVLGVCNYPLHLFSPVIAVSNGIFNTTVKGKPQLINKKQS